MKKILFTILVMVIVFLIVAFIALTSGLSDGQNVVLNGIDLPHVSDGNYVGTYAHGRWTNTLIVHIENNRIIEIDIAKDVMVSNAEWTAEVFRKVIDTQDTQVDAISGATVTTKAYLKAIENALR